MQDKCESKGCAWKVTDDPSDCEMTTTATPGCCRGFSYKAQAKCVGLNDVIGCERMDCEWVQTDDPDDCEMTTTPPGCCRGSSYKAQPKCEGLSDQMGCERMSCEWVHTDDPRDCVITTSSTTETPGCCKGDSAKSNPMCNARLTRAQCDKSSSCHFIENGDVDVECAVDSTTILPGCCYGNPDSAYSKRWMDTCTGYFTERECTKMSDSEGTPRCAWEPLGDYMDCAMSWPTTTTTTIAPGCCRGFSFKAQAKCQMAMEQGKCEDKGCEWVQTEDPDDCVLTTTSTTTTTETPGCCAGDSVRTTERCNKMEGREKCERSSSCHFVPNGDLERDCSFDELTTSIEPGCCYGNPDAAYSKRWMESCTAFYTERDCLLLTNGDGDNRCHWEPLGEGYDCEQLWPTTTSTTVKPGCCRGFSYKAQAKCEGLSDQMGCERKDCEWVETDDPSVCEMTTTSTSSTSTTSSPPGCCKADSARHQGLCAMKLTSSKCDRSSSCHWLESEDPSACDFEETTTLTPGCCYGYPDAAYSKRWMESCKAFFTRW